MKTIVIKGDFELSGDVPGLKLCCKRMKYAEIELIEIQNVRLTQFEGIKDAKEHNI